MEEILPRLRHQHAGVRGTSISVRNHASNHIFFPYSRLEFSTIVRFNTNGLNTSCLRFDDGAAYGLMTVIQRSDDGCKQGAETTATNQTNIRESTMPKRADFKISKRTVDRLFVEGKDRVFWDRDLPGFGVRVYPSGQKVYLAQCRTRGKPKRVNLGRHGELTPCQARKQATDFIQQLKRGMESADTPHAAATTVSDLAERYMSGHVAQNCSAHTASIYRGALTNHILPVLGAMPITAVNGGHASALHYEMRDTPRAANRALMILKKMFSLAAAWGLVPEGTNPCNGVRKYTEQTRERFLSPEEYRLLGQALTEANDAGTVSPFAVAALRLLMLTGCRHNEILTLRWDDVDRTAGEFRLRTGKTGARMVPITPAAERVIASIPRKADNPWVIAGGKPGKHLQDLYKDWNWLLARVGLRDVRIHDLRHSYASRALSAGESLSMIGKLLGHVDMESTARYAHLARHTEKMAAERVGASIGADISAGTDTAIPAVACQSRQE